MKKAYKVHTPPKLSPKEARENELMQQLFKNVAGTNEEVSWKELKEILDYYTKQEATLATKNVEMTETGDSRDSFLTALLSLLCGVLCKDNSMADGAIPTRSETKSRGFSKDVCRSMIAMLDTDRTGKLDFTEFKKLWNDIREWKNIFKKFDTNQTNTLNGFELREALNSAGYTLNTHVLNCLMHRYGNKEDEIEFDDFIMCATKLKMMIELFEKLADATSKTASFQMEEWVEYTLYA